MAVSMAPTSKRKVAGDSQASEADTHLDIDLPSLFAQTCISSMPSRPVRAIECAQGLHIALPGGQATQGLQLDAVRQERASCYLAHTMLSVEGIAASPEYVDTSNFSHTYRRRFGRTPSQARGADSYAALARRVVGLRVFLAAGFDAAMRLVGARAGFGRIASSSSANASAV